jgi:hypothetical protein
MFATTFYNYSSARRMERALLFTICYLMPIIKEINLKWIDSLCGSRFGSRVYAYLKVSGTNSPIKKFAVEVILPKSLQFARGTRQENPMAKNEDKEIKKFKQIQSSQFYF